MEKALVSVVVGSVEVINLTPHAVNFVGSDGAALATIPPSGQVARVAQTTVQTSVIGGIPVTQSSFGEVVDLPNEREGVIYLVSSLVASAAKGRADIFIPAEPVRDEAGRIIGCRSFGRI